MAAMHARGGSCAIMDGPMAQSPPLLPGDATDLADDIRELFEDLSRKGSATQGTYSGDCHPSLDVRETGLTVEVTIDVAGVPAEAIRVLFRSGVLLIAGDKTPAATSEPPIFHLVERAFGRFARAVRLGSAFDVQSARATLRDGELTITLPKQQERRGQAHRIPVA
jgi:HSP20 family protein